MSLASNVGLLGRYGLRASVNGDSYAGTRRVLMITGAWGVFSHRLGRLIMKVGVVSQRVLVRKALCSLLASSGIFAVVMDLERVLGPLRTSEKSKPLILVVHTTDSRAAAESLQHLHDTVPEARVILLADNPDEQFCVQALEAGAWGCLSTMDNPQLFVKAVVKVAEGERWFSRRVTNIIIEKLVSSRQLDTKTIANLTPREWQVLALLAKGCPDKEIANRLFISRETARSHVKSIYKKLQVRTRRAAAVYYFKRVRSQAGPNGLPRSPKMMSIPDVT